MAISGRALTLMKWLYWIIFGFAHLYVCYLLFQTDRSITGILWLILGSMLIYVMYNVYFPAGDPESHWPPYVSSCPDYLTLIAPNACVDYVGLGSRNLRMADPKNPPAVTDMQYVFNSSGSLAEKAKRATQYGLGWEGIL